MKKRMHGPSLYYATDKNIFDALTQHKVDTATVLKLFQRRSIIVGKKVPREDLAKYFSQLTHDYYDHKDIASRLGVAPRRERTTSMDISGIEEADDIHAAVEQLKQELEATGDVVQVSYDGDNISVNIQYSTVDYKRSEFTQVQVRDGTVQFVKSASGFIVRNTQNEYMNDVRDTLLAKVDKISDKPVSRTIVSLFDVPSPKLRSKFFHELMTNLPGFVRRDVTDVYVYKAKPEPVEDDSEDSSNDASDDALNDTDTDTHVERVFLRGNGVTRSQLLNGLLDEEDYYIVKAGWIATEILGDGNAFDIEAVFADYRDCSDFSFLLHGVFPLEEGKISKRRRPPMKSEIDTISRAIEAKSRELMSKIREEFTALGGGGTHA